ncbi:hypothetical protein SteCoe_11259 [Stentor coeruleus]|uniref:Uncharacterized protein n=1 Tax=Stentor coeruleus TaxID=5963 RepID=A0A1R2CDM1_9CILI|nr:hypothetical protein SteCoe_11259 [Stentor coeruleus]
MAARIFAYAAAALCTTAAVAMYIRSRNNSKDYIKKTILTKESYKEVCHEIRKYFSEIYYKELNLSRIERRSLISRSAEYEKIASNFQKRLKPMLEEAQLKTIKQYRISKKYFEDSVNYYDSDPELKEFGDQLVQPLPMKNTGKKLSKEETRVILNYYSTRLKEFESECPDLDEYMLINMQIEDEIYRTYKVEMEDLNAGFEMYKSDMEDIVEPLKNQTSYVFASTDDSF